MINFRLFNPDFVGWFFDYFVSYISFFDTIFFQFIFLETIAVQNQLGTDFIIFAFENERDLPFITDFDYSLDISFDDARSSVVD